MTYSANREDDLILEHFGAYKGRFLDLGALDGRIGSNVLRFAELGWAGVAVEASYRNVGDWLRLYRSYPKIQLVHAAIGVEGGLTRMWDTQDQSLSTCSTRLQNRGKGREVDVNCLIVSSFTIRDLMSLFPGTFDYVSIDIEGWTIPVLQTIPFDELETRALCVEWFHEDVFGEDEPAAIREILKPFGFRELAKTPENLVMVR